MKNTCPFHIVFQVFSIHLIKILRQSNQISYFLLFFIFYISRNIIFSQIFRTSFNIICKKDFCHEFSFLTDSLKTPHPLNAQNLLSVTKFCCRCSPKIYNKQKILYVKTAKVNSKDVKGSNFVHSEEFPSIFKF